MLSRTTSPATSYSSLRVQLLTGFGLLAVLIAAVVGVTLVSFVHIRQLTAQTITVEGQISRLANHVAIQTLLCRRFEKDLFLNLASTDEQIRYFAKWQTAVTQLEQAITAYSKVAVSATDQQQAEEWNTATRQYHQAVEQVVREIQAGRIRTPEAANAALTPAKEPIRTLTDSAVAIAEQRDRGVQQADALLVTAITTRSIGVLILGLVAVVLATIWSLLIPTRLMSPIKSLHQAAQDFATGNFAARVSLARRDELGALADSFNTMAQMIEQRTNHLITERAVSEEARRAAVEAHDQIAAQLVTIEQQQHVIRELSVPTLPLSPTVLVMPLVGALDTERLTLIQQQALENIERARARHLILDISAVPVVDTQVGQGLIQIVQAARLLGAEVVIVGIRPEVAQTVVSLGIRMDMISTCSSLYEGIEYTRRTSKIATKHS